MKHRDRIARTYKAAAVMLLNAGVLFLILNLALWVVIEINDRFFEVEESNPVSLKYSNPSFAKVYPGMSEEAVNDLLIETWTRPYVYEAFTQFKERPHAGRYVNVDENGFRVSRNQGPWPPDPGNLNIFLFGGSTTFGYGVPDDETIASHLQEFLSQALDRDVRVYNFARGFYYSTQERILLQQLLFAGFVPDMAILVDGLNEFFHHNDRPWFTDRFEELLRDRRPAAEPASLELRLLDRLPLVRLARSLKHRLGGAPAQDDAAAMVERSGVVQDEDAFADVPTLARVVERYRKNKRMIEAIADVHGVQTLFVWQPVPTYKYDPSAHLLVELGFNPEHGYSKYGYEYMEGLLDGQPSESNFLWLADMQEGSSEPLYVDQVHYSPAMSAKVAAAIGELMLERGLIRRP